MSLEPDLAPRIREAALLEGDFVLSSGERSSFYVDKYLFSTEPDLLRDVADALAEQLPEGVERLAGVELGAVPLVVATALATGLPYVIVRKSRQRARQLRRAEHRGRARRRREGCPDRGRRHHGHAGPEGGREPEGGGVEVVTIVAVLDRREEAGQNSADFLSGPCLGWRICG